MTYKTLKTISLSALLSGIICLSSLNVKADEAICQKSLHTFNNLVAYGKDFSNLVRQFKNKVSGLTKSDLSQFEIARAQFDRSVSALSQKYGGVTKSQYEPTVQSIKENCPKAQWPAQIKH